MDVITLIIFGLIVSVIVMTLTWLVCGELGKSSWVDVVWAYTIGMLSLVFYLLIDQTTYTLLPLLLILAWSARLGTHLARRIASESEDGRYKALKAKWDGHHSPMMFGFFMMQAAAAFLFSLPPLLSMRNVDGAFSTNEVVAITIALIAIIGESTVDAQLNRFKKNPSNKGQVCKAGLWKYSRHPNYFFEWFFWLAFPIVSFHTPAFLPLLAAPAIMLVLVLKITGITPTEAQAIRKRGDLYRQYQRETSAFVPWFPKKTKQQ